MDRLTKEEREWRAQSDLRALQQAEEIRKDPGRRRAAESQARKQLQAAAKQVQSLKKVTGKRTK